MDILIKGKKYNYKVESDSRNYIISKEYIANNDSTRYKKGDRVYKDIAYFSNLPDTFNKLLQLELNDSDIRALGELKKAQVELRNWLEKEFRGMD